MYVLNKPTKIQEDRFIGDLVAFISVTFIRIDLKFFGNFSQILILQQMQYKTFFFKIGSGGNPLRKSIINDVNCGSYLNVKWQAFGRYVVSHIIVIDHSIIT